MSRKPGLLAFDPSLKDWIRSLSREAAIQVLLGIVDAFERGVSRRQLDLVGRVSDGEKLMDAKRLSGGAS